MIRDIFRRVFALIKKEFITIWKDPKSRGIIIMLPLMQLLIFSNAVTMEVNNIDVAVIDRCNSVESRELLSRFENSPRFRKFYYTSSEQDFKKVLDTQKVQIGLYINDDFSKNIKLKNQQLFRFLQMEDRQMSQVLQVLTQHKLLQTSARKYLQTEMRKLTSLQGIGLTRILSINGIF